MAEQKARGRSTPYKYTGKELNDEIGLYDYGARFYDPSIAVWTSVDPLTGDMPDHGAYNYTFQNPIMFNDPIGKKGEGVDGITHTIVIANDDGTYSVVGGDANDGDTGVYLDDGNGGKVKKIGDSVSPGSFMQDDGTPAMNAQINLESSDGQEFLDDLYAKDPNIFEYVGSAKGFEPYDYKTHCAPNSDNPKVNIAHKYRGSKLSDGRIASARDIGNIGAGYMAARHGFAWPLSRFALNTLETKQMNDSSMGAAIFGYKGVGVYGGMVYPKLDRHQEGQTSQAAQRVGFKAGLSARSGINASKRYY